MADEHRKDLTGLNLTRRKLLKTSGSAALGGTALSALGLGAPAFAQDKIYQWGSASLGSTGYQIITVLSAAVAKHTDLRSSALSTAGGAENMALIGEGIIDFGQSTTSDWYPALSGEGRYEGNPVDAVQMFSYMVWQANPLVRADSDIHTLDDLRGRRVSPSTAGGANAGLWEAVFKAAGIYDDIDWTYGSWREVYDGLASGGIDAIPVLLAAGERSGLVEELESSVETRIIPIPEEVIEEAQKINPGVMKSTVTPEQYPSLSEPMLMVAYAGILAAHPDVSEEAAYAVTKAVYENAEEIRRTGGPRLDLIRLDTATEYLIPQYPVHAGAARYFQEAGVWRDDLTIAE